MRTGAAATTEGIFHEASIYSSDAELRDTALPFLSDGLDANEPTYVILGPRNNELIRRELGERDGLHYVLATDAYVNPSATVRSYRDLLNAEVAAGAAQIRFITEVPHPGMGTAWDWWGRYEAAANHIFADLPVWAICSYDQRTTPPEVIDEVIRAHPFIAGADGAHSHNLDFRAPSAFLDPRSCTYVDPLEAAPPAFELINPTPAQARRAAVAVARPLIGDSRAEDLALALSEVTANAAAYGASPVEVRLWAAADRVVATVADRGTGVDDVTIGLAPVGADPHVGRGLWIATQVCDHLGVSRSDDGFMVRLVMGTPSITH